MTAFSCVLTKENEYDRISSTLKSVRKGNYIRIGGYTLCPRKGVMLMQYVTYENLFAFAVVIIGIVGLFIDREHKKK